MIAGIDVTDERSVLASLVGDVDRFMAESFGRSPWFGSTGSLSGLFGVDQVDFIVSSAVRAPAIRMIRDGRRLDASLFCTTTRIGGSNITDTADAAKVLDQYRRGATLVLQSLQRTWPPLADWCSALERELNWPVQANAYLTPPGQRGLSRHSDNHDVFVVQLHGHKQWHVEGQTDRRVTPGTVLYLPAGTAHEAATTDQSSLHLTIGVHRPGAEQIVDAAVEIARRRTELVDGESRLQTIAGELAMVRDEEAIDRLRRPPRVPATGRLAASIRRPPVEPTTRLRVHTTWRIGHRTDDKVVLNWDEGRLVLPGSTIPALVQLARQSDRPTAVGDLESLDSDGQLVLARRLLDEGAVTLCQIGVGIGAVPEDCSGQYPGRGER